MKKLLFVKSSPRGERSSSSQIAESFLTAYRQTHPGALIDNIDLFQTALPEFDGDRAAAKMSFFGQGVLEGALKTAWDEIVEITSRFSSADDFLFTVPMWNGGIPYRLKLYIDIMTQPGLLFGFDPVQGYSGLLKGKRATAIYTSGVYAPGVPPAFGTDHHSTYFNDWLRLIGIEDVAAVRYQPNLVTNDAAGGLLRAQADATTAAMR